jgi:hypothetical protein
MELSFSLPHHDKVVHVRAAAVVWCGTMGPVGPEGAGLFFLTIDGETKKRIDSFVETQIGQSPDPWDETTAVGENIR